jgi:hypothetical protein
MTLIERTGLYIVVPVVALLVAFGIGFHAGEKRIAGQWAAAVAAEHQRELAAVASANAAEAKLSQVTASADSTADQLEQAREALLAKVPPIAACADDAADLGELRRLIEPR